MGVYRLKQTLGVSFIHEFLRRSKFTSLHIFSPQLLIHEFVIYDDIARSADNHLPSPIVVSFFNCCVPTYDKLPYGISCRLFPYVFYENYSFFAVSAGMVTAFYSISLILDLNVCSFFSE